MRAAIHQPQYLPWLGYFHKMASVDLFVYLNDVQFKKNEWQHRNRIRNTTGFQWLSVPTSYVYPQKINEVQIVNQEHWRKKHVLSLQACYGKSPCFEEVWPRFAEFYTKQWTAIDRLNIDSAELLAGIMGIETKRVVSSDYTFEGTSTERLVNVCRHFGADTYLAGAGGHEYMDLGLFEKAGIRVEFQDFHCPVYPQRFCAGATGFIANLSAADLVFNCGPESYNVLMGQESGSGR
jgi:hypothetical protein